MPKTLQQAIHHFIVSCAIAESINLDGTIEGCEEGENKVQKVVKSVIQKKYRDVLDRLKSEMKIKSMDDIEKIKLI